VAGTGYRRGSPGRAAPADPHIDALDGVRAIAAFAVLTFHVAIESGAALGDDFFTGLLARGDVAVPIFFTLSGLLLYRPWAAAALTGGPAPDTRAYLVRRALRILPAYWLVVAAALALWSRDRLGDPGTWLVLLTLTQTYHPDPWWAGLGPKGLAQMWSLCVEAAFYLLLPLLAAGLAAFARRAGADVGRRARRLLLGLAVLALASPVTVVLSHHPVYLPHLNSWLPRSMAYFACGMAFAVVLAWAEGDRSPGNPARRLRRSVASAPGTLWLVAALAYAIAVTPVAGPRFIGVEGVWPGLFKTVLYATVAVCLVAPAALPPRPAPLIGRILGNRVIRWLGRISYGVFLWQFVALHAWYQLTAQWPFTGGFLGNLVAVAAITIMLAEATHRLVEEPARGLGRRISARLRRGAAAGDAASAAAPHVKPEHANRSSSGALP
jgi:peptidoglycan/LPS O-acetylase OafA/YrhL